MAVGETRVAELIAELSSEAPGARRDAANGSLDHVTQYSASEARSVGLALIRRAHTEDDADVQESIANALAELAVNSLLGPELVRSAADIPDFGDSGVQEQLEYLRDKAAGFPGADAP